MQCALINRLLQVGFTGNVAVFSRVMVLVRIFSYIIDPLNGMQAENAPANVFLKVVDNCFLSFAHDRHDSYREKWYS